MTEENKKIGLMGKKKMTKNNEYVSDITPSQPYNGSLNSNDVLKDERGTLRIPMEQKLEFDALLQILPDYSYTYELFAELVYDKVKDLSKEQNQKYQSTLRDLREKEANKKLKKLNKNR